MGIYEFMRYLGDWSNLVLGVFLSGEHCGSFFSFRFRDWPVWYLQGEWEIIYTADVGERV
jgi:hypothetical protein